MPSVHELPSALTAMGRFTVKDCLGSGAFGVVYDVYDAQTDARVALKWLRNTDGSALARFKREFRSLADIVHPNLVGFRELLTVGGEWFFTMDLVEGIDLLKYVRPASPPPTEKARAEKEPSTEPDPSRRPPASGQKTEMLDASRPLCIADLRRLRTTFEQLGAGLDALHAAGQLHRDIKPSNVLVTRDGRVVLLDLGLVTELADGVAQTQSGQVVGTPIYMSPEQALGLALTPKSDWYAVGVILFQALTGMLPFEGPAQALLLQKQLEEPKSPSDLVLGVPKALAELCTDLLARVPDKRPSGAEFLHRLRKAIPLDRPPSTGNARRDSGPIAASFVGRETHLWALDEALGEAERGKTVLALVHGSSGMGKTALVRHFLDGLRKDRPEVVILEGRCYERESVPYKALDSLVDSLCRYLDRLPEVQVAKLLPRNIEALARVFPVFLQIDASWRKRPRSRIDAVQERRRAFEALRELLARVADRSPLVLFIDDLQWGDADSEPLLTSLLRPPDPPPLLLIAAYRTEDAATSPLVRSLHRIAQSNTAEACEIPVGELSPDAARDLAISLLGERGDRRLAESLARESFGSPLFLKQLAVVRTGEQRFDLATAIRERVARLPAPSRALLEVLAVCGRPIALPIAARVAGIESDAQGVLGKLRAETLVRTRGTDARDEIEIYHDRIREVVLADLEPSAIEQRHRKLATALAAAGADPETLATHYHAAGERDLAANYAKQAGERAAEALAFERAAEMYELALELGSANDSTSQRLVVDLAEALANAGRGGEAADRFLQAAKNAGPADALELRRRGAEQLLLSGHLERGLALVDEILTAMKMRPPRTRIGAIASLLWRRLLLWIRGFGFAERTADQISRERLVRIDTCFTLSRGLGLVDPVLGSDFQTRYMLLALAAGEASRIAIGFALEAAFRAAEGPRAKGTVDELLTEAALLSDKVQKPYASALVMLTHGVSRVLFGDYARGLALCNKAGIALREKCTGVAWEIDNADLFEGFSMISCGRLRELSERVESQLADVRARGDIYGEIVLRMQCAWFAHLAKNDVAAARADMDCVPESWRGDRFLLQDVWQMLNGIDIELYDGRPQAAWAIATTAWPRIKASLFLRVQTLRVRAHHARARAALAAAFSTKDDSERRTLVSAAARECRTLRRMKWPHAAGMAAILEASLRKLEGDTKGAIAKLRDGIGRLDLEDCRLQLCCARYRLGQAVGGDEGAGIVTAARTELEELGVVAPEKMVAMFVPFE